MGKTRFVDVAHGAVIIEYEAPNCFSGKEGAKLRHAQEQAEEYAELLALEEGRSIEEYVLVAWDGSHICFGKISGLTPKWEKLLECNKIALERLLSELNKNGIPLVHPALLSQFVGPGTKHGSELIPLFYQAIQSAKKTGGNKSCLLFMEWSRLFGQVVGIQTDSLRQFLAKQADVHGVDYNADPAAFLFALNTYIALLAKLVAGCSLPNASQDILDISVPIQARLFELESGELFESAGIVNMLNGDFFSWYIDDHKWKEFEPGLDRLVSEMTGINYDISKKDPRTTRDLFKGIYETFVPRELRHALGEFYTPDWLAEHGVNVLGWSPDKSFLDPTCGSGTFLLEALKRRRMAFNKSASASHLLDGIFGIDLNPLAVLSAKASIAVFIAPSLDPSSPVSIPVYLADAINTANKNDKNCLEHLIQTEKGKIRFECPEQLVTRDDFYALFGRIRTLIDADLPHKKIEEIIKLEFSLPSLSIEQNTAFEKLIISLVNLHNQGWNGIWCPILADRFSAGAIGPVDFICGNPPWVKWSHLPREYADFIQPKCRAMGVFSSDRWVGGIESDISTVITFESVDKYLSDGGKLGFFITGTVFTNESSEGFRNFSLRNGAVHCSVERVEDFKSILPFEDVSNHPAFLIIQRGRKTSYPISYHLWTATDKEGKKTRIFDSASDFTSVAVSQKLYAQPVPGDGNSRPWIIGSRKDQKLYKKVFGPPSGIYSARKGVTVDLYGVYLVEAQNSDPSGVTIRNVPSAGKTKGLQTITRKIEATHLFPLLRGRGVKPFVAEVDDLKILVPQREMHGDPELHISAPATARYFAKFKNRLEKRSSYRRFQEKQGAPYYSVWSTGPYTFSPYKVLWREMSGNKFAAAYIGSVDDPILGRKLVIPNHKLYFIPAKTELEAAYLTGFLNAPVVERAISAYASQLSLGVSVAEYLRIPEYDSKNKDHAKLARLSKRITKRGYGPTDKDLDMLDSIASLLLGI